jgi:hypothetical protein
MEKLMDTILNFVARVSSGTSSLDEWLYSRLLGWLQGLLG